MSVIPLNHNFPFDLNIRPSTSSATRSEDTRFGEIAQASAISKFGIAGRVWEASYILLSYLDCSNRDAPDQLEFDPPPFTRMACADPLTIIELGSGTGLVASRIAEHLRVDRDLLLATDLPDVCGLLESNLQACPAIRVQPLTWGSMEDAVALAISLGLTTPGADEAPSPRHPTHIICSDLVRPLTSFPNRRSPSPYFPRRYISPHCSRRSSALYCTSHLLPSGRPQARAQ